MNTEIRGTTVLLDVRTALVEVGTIVVRIESSWVRTVRNHFASTDTDGDVADGMSVEGQVTHGHGRARSRFTTCAHATRVSGRPILSIQQIGAVAKHSPVCPSCGRRAVGISGGTRGAHMASDTTPSGAALGVVLMGTLVVNGHRGRVDTLTSSTAAREEATAAAATATGAGCAALNVTAARAFATLVRPTAWQGVVLTLARATPGRHGAALVGGRTRAESGLVSTRTAQAAILAHSGAVALHFKLVVIREHLEWLRSSQVALKMNQGIVTISSGVSPETIRTLVEYGINIGSRQDHADSQNQ